MKPIDLSIPLGVGTPAWPTYEPLQVKYFKRLAPNGANGQLVTHSNHVGTHLDGEIHFYTPGKDIAELELDYLMADGVVVDLSDVAGEYDIYTSEMIESKVDVKEGDILIISTGYHKFGWDQPSADEVKYMIKHPGPDREFAEWCKAKKLRWIGVDCGSADHPMNTKIRDWMPQQATECDTHFKEKYGKGLYDIFTPDKYQLMHLEMFPFGIVHAECLGGDIDLLLNRRVKIGCFPWRFVQGESCVARIVAFVEDDEYDELMATKAKCKLTKHGDIARAENQWLVDEANARAKK